MGLAYLVDATGDDVAAGLPKLGSDQGVVLD